jgi:putative ABC transport system ATP-binding protein
MKENLVLRLENVSRLISNPTSQEDGKWIIRNVNLDILQGEIFCIVGPSGSGKTSLLRLINALDEPTEGRIFYRGKDISEINPIELRRRIILVFQKPTVFEGTISENLTYAPSRMGFALNIDQSEIENMLIEIGFNKRDLNRDAQTLSTGEMQRICLLRAIILNPDVLLLDEPTSGLDPYSCRVIENIIMNLVKEKKLTLVIVSHMMAQARRISRRVALMKRGVILRCGLTEKIMEDREFVETMGV